MEKRKFLRVPFEIKAEIISEGQKFIVDVKDLSLKGLYVKSDHKFELKTPVDLKIDLSGNQTNLSINLKAEVVRVTDEGMGLFFSQMDLDSFIHLKNIVEYNAIDPERVREEFFEFVKTNVEHDHGGE
ncbi:MAG TPA: PilZ domain-containing protein [Bacillota bacterium]|nr:PilZ domain-containing protein [Bacillota bacterium]HOL09226.1 PilZ domain-containing protein [Bacillota bacterium]HPO97050.1 PilZ domain-containing protein [Bacillota bacterium]